ncbi:MAG: hypothetical protein JW836_05815, partial [Deltaproteobacteria bacterium]|nr:hypothetical protein [Deltaproteobacteria bacterium]
DVASSFLSFKRDPHAHSCRLQHFKQLNCYPLLTFKGPDNKLVFSGIFSLTVWEGVEIVIENPWR